LFDGPEPPLGAHRADWLVLHLLFYADFAFKARLAADSLAGCRSIRHRKGRGMEKQVVRLTVNLVVNDGQLEAFKSIAQSMTSVSQAEPGTLGYEWFSSADGKHFRLVETYVDSSALEAHFMGPAVQQWVPKLVEVSKPAALEIYGDPGPKVTEMASGFGAVVFQYWIGIGR
jgi:quinol monooxygenase YgiN